MNLAQIEATMVEHGFSTVENVSRDITDATLLMKRQTFNTNRGILVVEVSTLPNDFESLLKALRKQTAFRCRFFPFFWEIGIQVILSCPKISESDIHPQNHVAKISNQWAIIQSLFLLDPENRTLKTGRSPGQTSTGKYQDAILQVLVKDYKLTM